MKKSLDFVWISFLFLICQINTPEFFQAVKGKWNFSAMMMKSDYDIFNTDGSVKLPSINDPIKKFILYILLDISRLSSGDDDGGEVKMIDFKLFVRDSDFWPGVYILSRNFIIAPKAWQAQDENFYNCPQFACCAQWNILKFACFVPFVGCFCLEKLSKFWYNSI